MEPVKGKNFTGLFDYWLCGWADIRVAVIDITVCERYGLII